MEKALLISSEKKLRYWQPDYSRIYYGNEFCQRLIPSIDQISDVIDFSHKKNIKISITTPYVTDEGLYRLKNIFEFLCNNKLWIEIIVNDWGTLRMVNTEFRELIPVLGRLLVKIKREPRLSKIKNIVSADAWRQFQTPEAASPMFSYILKTQRIERIEFDNVFQGIRFSERESGLQASVYYPYIVLNTTRYCITASCEKPDAMIGIFPCRQECKKYTFSLKNKGMLKKITLKGNTQFLYNDRLPDNLKKIGIDRIVFQPEAPV